LKSHGLLLLSITGLAGCASVSAERGHDQVARLVEQRIGKRTQWDKGPPDDARVADWLRAQLALSLGRDRAIEIALVNNPDLQVTYEELGVSQADMVQAGLLSNPTLGADLGFDASGRAAEVRLSLVQDFLSLFVLPLRRRIAREQFEADVVRVGHRALEVAAEVSKEFTALQASAALLAYRRTLVEITDAALDLASRQLAAGNIGELTHATEKAAHEQAKLDLAREDLAMLEHRETINRLLGLWGATTAWTLAEQLPGLPDAEPRLEHLESLAIRQRLAVDSARRQAVLMGKAVDLARTSRLFGRIEIGIDAHRDPDGPRVLGPNLSLELPLFDQRQAYIARLEAERRQQERRLAALAIDARSEVRLAQGRLMANRRVAAHYRDVVLPGRKQILDLTQLHYNGMLTSLYQLLAAKREEVEAQRGYLEALRDYWIARADLERAVAGRLTTPGTPVPAEHAVPPASSPSEETHHHHGS
jgi:cobalt-zinc-cadmium efflux system outer membrane protein